MALSTFEARWFFPGSLEETGPGVEAWFRTAPGGGGPAPLAWDPAPPAWRQDHYLVVPGHDDMGIKWREGRLEIKGREAALGHTAFAPGSRACASAGSSGRTRAPRSSDVSSDCSRAAPRKGSSWSRSGACNATSGSTLVLARSRSAEMPPASAASISSSPRSGCLDRGSNRHWSLAFEAFPGDQQMAEPFAQVVAGFLDGCPALPLAAERSMAYPRWLLDLDRPAATSD